MDGKLIDFEGIDGSGKSTQVDLLLTYLKKNKLKHSYYKFPQHQKTFFAKTIDRFLQGEFGKLDKVPPHLISLAYAFDRALVRDKIYADLNEGKIIVCDRYVNSNKAYQASRLPKNKRAEFLHWLDELDYKVNQNPREDLVIFMDIPVEKSLELRKSRVAMDLLEQNKPLQKTYEVYLSLFKKGKNWLRVNCVNSKGEIRSKEEIHQEIVKKLKEKKVT